MHLHLHRQDSELSVEYREAFFDAYLLLDDSNETFSALIELLDQAVLEGAAVPVLRYSKLRVLRTPVGSCPRPLRVYFLIEYQTLQFVYVQHYDENDP